MSANPITTLSLVAPLTGVLVPLDQVPDPVFARKMVGDGISIDPLSNVLLSPVFGEVVDVQPSGHAVTVRSDDGLEILMHIGLDTVRLVGEGFHPRVREGARVAAGDPLIEFDLDEVGRKAKSLLTQIVITNSEVVARIDAATGLVTAGIDVVATVVLADPTDGVGESSGVARAAASDGVLVPNPTGIHARPAATLAAMAKKFHSDVRLRRGEDSANAKSIVSVMGLAVGYREKVTFTAHGPDAEEAVSALAQAVRDGLGEDCPPLPTEEVTARRAAAEPEADGAAAAPVPAGPRSGDWNLLLGVAASPGLGIGRVVQLRRDDIEVDEVADDHHLERRKLNAAIDRALLDLSALQKRLEDESSPDKAAIFAAHQEILADPDLLDLAVSAIDKGKSAPFAWRGAFTAFAEQLSGLSNEVLAGRANDVRDVGQRVLE